MRSIRFSLMLMASAAVTIPAHAQERPWDFGIRAGISAADGEPANDIPGAGLIAHFALGERWRVGAALDRAEYDVEEPAKLAGVMQQPMSDPIDALAESTTFSAWAERMLTNPTRATTLFAGVGLGAAFIDVPDAAGPRADGGLFDIRTDASTEILVSLLGGVRRQFGDRWYGEAAVHAEQHFADWVFTDRVSGARGSIDDYLTWGVYIAVGWRW
ncbi:MAG TPA: hypothetical protein VGD45_29610 [Steroidobacter sp.]|uniref:hypothetical protein n=1 Tax=Steroidobacter sp. TaxID=1978227 RepID=UPI002ED818C1